MLDRQARDHLVQQVSAATRELTRGLRDDVELQLFGFGMRLVPPEAGLVLSWFLVPDQDLLIVTVVCTHCRRDDEHTWHLDPTAPGVLDEVTHLLHAGVHGQITVGRHAATAQLPDGTPTSTAPATSRAPRLRGLGARWHRPPPFPSGSGAVRIRDVVAAPPLLDELVEGVAPAIEAAGLVLRRTFAAEGIHGLPAPGGDLAFGWGAHADRADGRPAVSLWFDGLWHELLVTVADRHEFSWGVDDDPAAATEEAAGVVRAARFTPGPGDTATAHLADGRAITTEQPPPG